MAKLLDPKTCPHKNASPLWRQKGAEDPIDAKTWIKRGEECLDCGGFIPLGAAEASGVVRKR